MSDFCYANFDPMDLFFSVYPFFFLFTLFFVLFMGSTIKACYFLDFQNFLQINGKKEYCDHFGHLTDFLTQLQNRPNDQNCHSTLFYPFFAKHFENLKSNMLLLYSP